MPRITPAKRLTVKQEIPDKFSISINLEAPKISIQGPIEITVSGNTTSTHIASHWRGKEEFDIARNRLFPDDAAWNEFKERAMDILEEGPHG